MNKVISIFSQKNKRVRERLESIIKAIKETNEEREALLKATAKPDLKIVKLEDEDEDEP